MKRVLVHTLSLVLATSVCFSEGEADATATEATDTAVTIAAEPEAVTPVAEGKPALACDEPTFNFGEVDNNEDVVHTFVLRNTGGANLEISNVRPSCGCTVAKITTKSVPPGGSSEVTAKLSLRGRQGAQHKTITVESNDPDKPRFALQLNGSAVTEIEILPKRVFLGQGGEESAFSQEITIKANGSRPLNIKGVQVAQEYLETRLQTVTEGRHYIVHVLTKPPLPIGKLQSTIRVDTDNPKNPTLHIPVSVDVVGELAFAPSEIVLREESSGPVTRYVVVRPGKTANFKIEEVTAPNEDINVRIFEMGKNGYRIQLDNLKATKELDGQNVRILTDVDSMKEILIPIRIIGNPLAPQTS